MDPSTATASLLTAALNEFLHAPVALIVFIATIVFGYVLKAFQSFPNRMVPVACALFALITLPLVENPAHLPPDQCNPYVLFCVMGMCIGFVAWLLHGVATAALEKKFGMFPNKPKTTPSDNSPDSNNKEK